MTVKIKVSRTFSRCTPVRVSSLPSQIGHASLTASGYKPGAVDEDEEDSGNSDEEADDDNDDEADEEAADEVSEPHSNFYYDSV